MKAEEPTVSLVPLLKSKAVGQTRCMPKALIMILPREICLDSSRVILKRKKNLVTCGCTLGMARWSVAVEEAVAETREAPCKLKPSNLFAKTIPFGLLTGN